MDQPSEAAIRALERLGIEPSRFDAFFRGEAVIYSFPTWNEPGIALVQLVGNRWRSGIIEINDPGGGALDLLSFRDRSARLARALAASELELFGGAVIHRRLEDLLIRRGFERSGDAVPDELGGGTMEILFKVFTVTGSGE